MAALKPPSWIETEGCSGPNYIRSQPSREEAGILMMDIQNKYIPEFTLPYRNVTRYIKEVSNDWDRLDENQRNSIRKSFESMGINQNIKEGFGTDTITTNTNLDLAVNYVLQSPEQNTRTLMNALWNPTQIQMSQMGITSNNKDRIRETIYEWSIDNSYILHSNWRSYSVLSFFIFFIFILFIVIGVTNSGESGTNSFGRRR